ncbi:unnamed protein product [Soboliphyme baturini]|uniref:Ufd2P_core domain-containing protein n=1 Tax=Soboliphyme baturini TaxID=241478 RepID=A0A183J9M8_9BILA|nr:unnamed protein product [Soboliphyme baturini]
MNFLMNVLYTAPMHEIYFDDSPDIFKAFPEYFIEDVVDALFFVIENSASALSELSLDEMPFHILVLVCNPSLFKNPYLAAGVIEVIFLLCSQSHAAARNFLQAILNHPLSAANLYKSLTKFYSGKSSFIHKQSYAQTVDDIRRIFHSVSLGISLKAFVSSRLSWRFFFDSFSCQDICEKLQGASRGVRAQLRCKSIRLCRFAVM